MTDPTTFFCPKCGVLVPSDAPEGICPTCAAEGGLQLLAKGDESRSAADAAAVARELAESLPDYEILDLLGSGGAGLVYRARQRRLGRIVALKVLRPDVSEDPGFHQRFEREARALAQLDHPQVVRVYDFGTADSFCYLVLEYIEGANLRELARSGGLRSDQALELAGQLCEALQYAHDRGIVHRDIKPENILVDVDGRVRITDFGLAKMVHRNDGFSTLTHQGQVMGTPHYMAPEQIGTPTQVDHRADLYSLGVVLYELLTGRLPKGAFQDPSQLARVDRGLDQVVRRSLEADPVRRYQSAREIHGELRRFSNAAPPTGSGPESAESTAPQPKKPHGWMGYAVIAALIVLMIIAFQFERESPPGSPLLGEAAEEGDLSLVERIVKHRWDPRVPHDDIDAPDHHERTPLYRAAMEGHGDVVQFLIDEGADIERADVDGVTPLMVAIQGKHQEATRYLLDRFKERNIDLHRQDNQGRTIMHYVAAAGDESVFGSLYYHAKPTAVDRSGRNPMHVAVEAAHGHLIRDLASAHSAWHNGQDREGLAPLHLAAASGNSELIKALTDLSGCELEIRDERGRTPLMHAAAEGGSVNAVRALLAAGASLTAKDTRGADVLYRAAAAGQTDLVQFLMDQLEEPSRGEAAAWFVLAYEAGCDERWAASHDAFERFFETRERVEHSLSLVEFQFREWSYSIADAGIPALAAYAALQAGDPDRANSRQPTAGKEGSPRPIITMKQGRSRLTMTAFFKENEIDAENLVFEWQAKNGSLRDPSRPNCPFH